jgi:hypothetical protein
LKLNNVGAERRATETLGISRAVRLKNWRMVALRLP